MSDVITDVVGATEAHEILGVEAQRISRWRRIGKLPPPYADLHLSPVWVRRDIERVRDGKNEFTPPPSEPPLVGTAEVAELLSVEKSQIARWRSRPPKSGPVFPEPAARIKAGPLWRRSDVMQFKLDRKRVLRNRVARRKRRAAKASQRAAKAV